MAVPIAILDFENSIFSLFDNIKQAVENGNRPDALSKIAALANVVNAGVGGTALVAQLGSYVAGGASVAGLAASLSNLSAVGLGVEVATSLINVGAAYNRTGDHGQGDSDFRLAVGKLVMQLAAGGLGFALAGWPGAALAFGLAGQLMDSQRTTEFVDGIANILNRLSSALVRIVTDPLILDLNGDGIHTSSVVESGVHFDFDGDGFAERTGWASSGDGILAIDVNKNGLIDNGAELFGSTTQDGFAVLEAFDSNGDGRIDLADDRFGEMRIWRDLNQNGVTDIGELQTLGDAGVASISLARSHVGGTDAGNLVGYEALFRRADGSTAIARTIYFATDRQDTRVDQTPTFTPATGIELLPRLPGSGTIHSVAYKATMDPAFRASWASLTDSAATMTAVELRSAFVALLLEWAGVADVDPHSRGQYVDARHLAFVEAFFGDSYREIQGGQELRGFPGNIQAGTLIEANFVQVVVALEAAFLAQVASSMIVRGADAASVFESPYSYFLLLDFEARQPGDPNAPATAGNVGLVADMLAAMVPAEPGQAATYLTKALIGLEGMVSIAYNNDRAAYANVVAPRLASITDITLHDIALAIVNGTARIGTASAEGILGTSGNDVVLAGGGGDYVDAGAGSDTIVYYKRDGDLWIKDGTTSTVDVDRLVLTDLKAADVSFGRIADSLQIKVTATGKVITVEDFFVNWTTEHRGVDLIRFADGVEWNRTTIQANSVYEGTSGNNLIQDSALDDVLHGGRGNDLIRIGVGSDTILYGRGDGWDVIEDTSDNSTGRDTLVLTNLNPDDVVVSRLQHWGGDAGQLIITVKATGEQIVDTSFFDFSGTAQSWNGGRGIDNIKFADGTAWSRDLILQNALIRGDDKANQLYGSGLRDTFASGGGDDILQGGGGGDLYIWRQGDGNDRIIDLSNAANETDTLWLQGVVSTGVRLSYRGSTLLIAIGDSGNQVIEIDGMLDVGNLRSEWNANRYGVDQIVFFDEIWDRQRIFEEISKSYFGKYLERRDTDTAVQNLIGDVKRTLYLKDEFGREQDLTYWIVNRIEGRVYDQAYLMFDSYTVLYGNIHATGNFLGNRLIGLDGDDILTDVDGDDYIDGGKGNDTIAGGDGNDFLAGGDGLDSLSGGSGNDTIWGDAGKDYIDGGIGDDIIVGGAGDDIIKGDDGIHGGSDTYIYRHGDGNDIITDEISVGGDTSIDRLVLSDLNSFDVEASRSGADLLLKNKYNGETIRIVGQFSGAGYGSGTGIEFIYFANGEIWTRSWIQAQAVLRGTVGRDLLETSRLDDVIEAGKGDDVIRSGGYADVGADSIVYSKGDGNDVLELSAGALHGSLWETLVLRDLNPNEVVFSRLGADLFIKVRETGDVIRVVAQLDGSGPVSVGLEAIRFADGSTWDRARIRSEAWYRGTDGRDLIWMSGGDDVVEGGKGDDVLNSDGFGRGSDTFVYSAGDGNDVINDGGDWQDVATDTLVFRDINPAGITLSRDGHDLFIRVIATGETIRVIWQFLGGANAMGEGLELIRFADGTEWNRELIFAAATTGSAFFSGTIGDDTIIGSALSQNLYGDRGNDFIDGKAGSDLLYGGLGEDVLTVSESLAGDIDTLNGGAGVDTADFGGFSAAVAVDLVSFGSEAQTRDAANLDAGTWRTIAKIEQVENVVGTAFDDRIGGDAGDNSLVGGTGNDSLDGRSGNDTLSGGDGDDVLIGGMGQDVLIGGAGNDTLTGGLDHDLYVFGPGFGLDVISDFVVGSGDVIRFDRSVFATFAAVMAAAQQVGPDVVIAVDGANQVTLRGVQLGDLTAADFSFRNLDNRAPSGIALSNRSVTENATAGTVVGLLSASDPDANDGHSFALVGGAAGLFEIVGNEVRVKQGALLDFEAAATHLVEVEATDLDGLKARSSIQISVTDAADIFVGTAADEQLTGGVGADVLSGAGGNDVLVGLAGADTYHYAVGDGVDRIVDAGTSGGEVDRLVLGAGILPTDIVVGRSSLNTSDIVLRIGEGGAIILNDQLSGVAGAGVEEVWFGNGTVWSRADILARLTADLILGTSLDETLSGSSGNDLFDPGPGSDVLRGLSGSDVYRIGDGFGGDSIVELDEAGTDRLELTALNATQVMLFRSGYDLLVTEISTGKVVEVVGQFGWGDAGIEQIAFADGVTWDRAQIRDNSFRAGTAGNDTITGTQGDDLLQAGAGNDIIHGGGGNDTIVYLNGDGNDIVDGAGAFSTDVDTIWLKDLNATDVTVSRQGTDVQVLVNSSGQTITLKDQFLPAPAVGVAQMKFADGITWDRATILANAWLRGTSGNDTLAGTVADDTLSGGAGDDIIDGGRGSDTYAYAAGDGYDRIVETSTVAGETDTLRLSGLGLVDVSFSRGPADLFIKVTATGHVITVTDQFGAAGKGLERIVFADGTIWGRTEINSNVTVWANGLNGTAGPDALNGTGAADVLSGLGGNDTLNGQDGDDILIGGAGDDWLVGGGGADTYSYALGDGADTIDDQGWGLGDKLVLTGINPADVSIDRDVPNGGKLVITFPGSSGDRITINDYFGSAGGIEQIAFADGTSWTVDDVRALLIVKAQTSGNDTIHGFGTDDVLNGGTGNDTLIGGGGMDTYVYALGDGIDTIDDQGWAGGDKLRLTGINPANVSIDRDAPSGGKLVITFAGSPGDRIVINDYFGAAGGIEQIIFADGTIWSIDDVKLRLIAKAQTSGNDVVSGFNGNDVLAGQAGDDTLNGQDGDDNLTGGAGNDVLIGGGGVDTYVYTLGDGADTIDDQGWGGGDRLVLHGIAAADVRVVRNGNDAHLLVGPGVTDRILIKGAFTDASRIETIAFDDGTNWTEQDVLAHVIPNDGSVITHEGTAGNDTLTGTSDADWIAGRTGTDTLRGIGGNDTYVFAAGDGNDMINDDSGSTSDVDTLKLVGLNASDILLSRAGEDLKVTVVSTGEVITVRYQFYSTTANWGIEKIAFADGTHWDLATISANAWFRGTSGNDTLTGTPDVDVFAGGQGNDTLRGIGGNDTYVFAAGDGNDVINDDSGSTSDVDTLKLVGLNASDILLSRAGEDLKVTVVSTGEVITVRYQFYSTTANWGIEKIAFADGTYWDLETIKANAWLRGTAGNDTLSGTTGNDTLHGGAGDDMLSGGAGSDTYVYALGDGADTINDQGGVTGDKLVLRGIAVADVRVVRSGGDATLLVGPNATDRILIKDAFGLGGRIETIAFDDGTNWGEQDMLAHLVPGDPPVVTHNGTPGNDSIYGSSGADVLSGGAGNDWQRGGAGDDTYLFGIGSGIDTIDEEGEDTGSADRILFSAGITQSDVTFSRAGNNLVITLNGTADQLTIVDGIWSLANDANIGRDRVEYFDFADGTQLNLADVATKLLRGTSGDDTITGFNTDDTLDGGAGNDWMRGASGNDTYLFGAGSGVDRIDEEGGSSSTADRILFSPGLTEADVTFSQSGNDLVIKVNGTSDQLTVVDGLWPLVNDPNIAWDRVEYYDFDNGTRLSLADVVTKLLHGTTGNDTIIGFNTDDKLQGGQGNDTLTGNAGNDRFIFASGFGNDTITDFMAGVGAGDIIEFRGGVFADFAAVTAAAIQSGNDVVITASVDDKITLRNVALANLNADDFLFAS